MKIAEIKELLQGEPAAELLLQLRGDSRSGVRKLLEAYDKRLAKEAAEKERFETMLRYENSTGPQTHDISPV